LRNHTGGPFLPAKLAPFLAAIDSGKLQGIPPVPTLRLGRRVLIRREALDAWILAIEAVETAGAGEAQ
jgi:hypothetical protein